MPYSPPDLGHIIMTADAIKSAQRQTATDQLRDQYLGQQIQAGKQQMDQSAQQNQVALDAGTAKQRYLAATAIAHSDDPIGAVNNFAPEMKQTFESQNGPGSFNQLTPDQVRAIAQHAAPLFAAHAGIQTPTQMQTIGDPNNPAAGVLQKNPDTGELKQIVAPKDPMEGLRLQYTKQQLDETARHNKVKEASDAADQNPLGLGAQSNTGQAPNQTNGDQFLQTLPKNIGDQVKALAEGRMAFPSGMALKTPYWQQMITAVSQYDPNFDAVNYNARSKTRSAFTSGKEANVVNNLNTAIGHAGTLYSQIDGTAGHSGFPFATTVNAVQNSMSERSGNPAVPLFKDTAGKLAEELTAAYRGSGGAEKDVVRALQSLDENASTETKKAIIGNAVELLDSKLNALNDQYNTGLGTTNRPLPTLSAKSIATIEKLRGVQQAPQPNQSSQMPTTNAQGWVLHKDAQGRQAYVSPDGKQYQVVQ